jgi:uncharacterized membrane protein YeiH
MRRYGRRPWRNIGVPRRRIKSVTPAHLLRAVDLAATFVFAFEGASVGTDAYLHVLGVLVVGFATALVGGIIRDTLLGDTPPAALQSIEYPIVAFLASGLAFIVDQYVRNIPTWLITGMDAAGLGLFCVVGAVKALDHGMSPLIAVMLGTISAVGGGVTRDVLLNRVPVVLNGELYATAAVFGGTIAVLAVKVGLSRPWAMTLGFVGCFVLRVLSAWQNWSLPIAHR